MSTALAGAELELAAAFARLSRVMGTPAELAARQSVVAAQNRLAAVRAATQVVAEKQCCGMPMTWHGNEWICTHGHD